MKNVTANSDDDKRQYFRVDDIAILSYRSVSRAEIQSTHTQNTSLPMQKFTFKAKLDRLGRELQPLYNVIKSSNSNIAMYLAILDQKIDLISECIIHNDEIESDVEPQQINIGAGGLSFISDKPFVSGAMLEIQMKLLPENMIIFSYARIISCTQVEESAEQKEYKISVEFEFMDDDVRDLITRHVLGKERAYLNQV